MRSVLPTLDEDGAVMAAHVYSEMFWLVGQIKTCECVPCTILTQAFRESRPRHVRRSHEFVFSRTELAVLKLVSRGLNNSEIARELRLSDHTVKNNLSQVYKKLGVVGRAAASVVAWRLGLVHD